MPGRLRLTGDLSFGGTPYRSFTSLAKKLRNNEVKAATSVVELTTDEFESGFVEVDVAVDAKLIAANAALKVGTRIYLNEYVKFREYQEGDEIVRWGVGLRFIFTVDTLDLSLCIDSLTGLAAASELKLANIKCSYQVLGIQGPKVLACLPKTSDAFNLDKLTSISDALDNVRALIYDPEGVIIHPVCLAESSGGSSASLIARTPEFSPTVLALQCVSNGLSLDDARVELVQRRKLSTPGLKLVEDLYLVHVPATSSSAATRPSKIEQEAAKSILWGSVK